MVRLAYGVVTARDQRVWDARGRSLSGGRTHASPADGMGPGAPVVLTASATPPVASGAAPQVGEERAPDQAVAELARLVERGGVIAAGAGVELCPGYVSARLEGARGDRRDAVLAAVQALGLDGLHRLGDRAGVLVALFGVEATKPVAAAASAAIADGRWAALRLASAASGLLGAEQLERVLCLGADQAEPGTPLNTADEGAEAAASTMAEHLGKVLGTYPRRRRLDLLLSLWAETATRQEANRRRARRLATQGKQSRQEELAARYARHEDDFLLQRVRADVGHEPTVLEAARWVWKPWHWTMFMNRAMHNAMSATVLLRTAVAVADHGVQQGMALMTDQLGAAAALMDSHEAGAAARRVPGLAGLPARPGCYVRELASRKNPTEPYVTQRLARARDYAETVIDAAIELIEEAADQLHGWSLGSMREWRAAVGYTAQRPPSTWPQFPVADQRRLPLERRPDGDETVGDLLWLADLADALAQLNGHERAEVHHGPLIPSFDCDPSSDDPPPESIPAALALAAQLVSLGVPPPRQCRDWAGLTAGLAAGVEVAEALAFEVPEPLAALDGTVIPGTQARLEWARHPRTLAQWAAYMGNCIAGSHYVEQAVKGACALAALRAPDGRIMANAEVRHRRQGWQITELQARYNSEPDAELRDGLTRRLASLPPLPPPSPILSPAPSAPPEQPVRERAPAVTPRRRLFREVSGPLAELAGSAMSHPETVAALRVLAVGAHGSSPADVVTPLRRLPADRVERACRDLLLAAGLPELWRATGVRPLTRALAGLDPELTARYERLGLLTADTPLPGSLRELARHGAIAPARSMELVGRRFRAALGRLARGADPVLGRQVAVRPGTDALCSLVLAITCSDPGPETVPVTVPGETIVPGFPRTDLADPAGPWRRAVPGAVELGADPDTLGERMAAGELRVPTAWLGRGGWAALWQRAARTR
ncbi:hypothetical protein [Nonomuraea rhizosphaerae]|uniref:hypothetical protein n=1 Tax=Nonomuraea rhizosphaerae TaxID=2665663 RepID=UPI001C5F7C0E|nr:hypothetical protein [Nonomuraea rhizosphaerae]